MESARESPELSLMKYEPGGMPRSRNGAEALTPDGQVRELVAHLRRGSPRTKARGGASAFRPG